MNLWDWIIQFEEDALARGEHELVRMCDFRRQAQDFPHDPDRRLRAYEQGRAAARALNQPWWVLYYQHWVLQVLLHYKGDFRQVHQLAVEATLEARKPAFAQFPQRVCLHEDLIWSYVNTDPLGHEELIEDALAYMEKEITPDLDCRYCLQHCRAEFALLQGKLDVAESAARRALEMADGEDRQSSANHHAAYAHAKLCVRAFAQREWEALRLHAREGASLAAACNYPEMLGTFLLWQAVVARQAGEEADAQRLLRRALRTAASTQDQRGPRYFDALAAFHEMGGDVEKALAARDEELAEVRDKGALYREARVSIERSRLLGRLGRLADDDLAKARAAVGRLKRPEGCLKELDKLAEGRP